MSCLMAFVCFWHAFVFTSSMQVDRLHAGLLRNGLTGEVNLEEGGQSLRYPTQVVFDSIHMDISARLDIY